MTQPNRIVVNTGPLIALSAIEHLDLLNTLYDEIMVPRQVHDEVLRGNEFGKDTAAYGNARFLRVMELTTPPDPVLSAMLDRGEAAVIQLARQEHIDQILIDERKGRKIARDIYGLTVFGTLRLLVDAKRENLLPNISEPIRLMLNYGYRIHDTIVQAALQEAGEN